MFTEGPEKLTLDLPTMHTDKCLTVYDSKTKRNIDASWLKGGGSTVLSSLYSLGRGSGQWKDQHNGLVGYVHEKEQSCIQWML
jgi:hypothetical protein